ncbi:hypothetical protein PHYBLDRAFT_162125 [Phycomyces blakesleeanus NRRL 1555(-)]|uniref:Uncharacterized protein n=1 Tax=Phycomyces blakesleeanus (strain ATCC 8743b / DSM 1359 / FGSC 10004 / NBRC 33097 / NRRL 1555) TaxID=763407 RepID=A0A162QB06_PHYB8|nr:hypothetical protein PHYBLDRAFT_162125 [Phycomyces blakesleeanus NRRL 1555(-)]OAD81526.1 hypothetical protein PHYBLDRAFT_162125 [Phycomyces blakesleeanus NRRL 1555(-)]|eukprot:XP_018299566.1 hypothetical protein PHYBLDRAFT_162125 [Phycomyces blakesleeanus NRRL 1555(-)]
MRANCTFEIIGTFDPKSVQEIHRPIQDTKDYYFTVVAGKGYSKTRPVYCIAYGEVIEKFNVANLTPGCLYKISVLGHYLHPLKEGKTHPSIDSRFIALQIKLSV